jgi:hypothetical protein
MNKQREFLWNGFGLTSNGILQLDAAAGIAGPLKSPGKFVRMSFLKKIASNTAAIEALAHEIEQHWGRNQNTND